MLASERVLGPRWSQKELRTFYILLKAYGKQWERLEERLPSRTNAMIRALFDMHRGYLSLPEASVEGFCTIMTDHYKILDELRLEQEKGGGMAATNEDVRRVTAQASPSLPRAAMMPLERMTPPTVSAARVKDETPPSDTRAKKKRKLERFLARDGTSVETHNGVVTKAEQGDTDEYQEKRHVRSRKAAWPVASTRRGNWLRDTDRFSASKFDLPWCYWFYSFVDVDFFNHNEFIECLQRMQLGNLVKAARPIWASVRASMGHPRRLSRRFLAEEKQKLEHYREVKRRADATPQSTRWPYKTPITLAAGLPVLAQLSHPPRFVSGTIEHFSARDGVCKVRLDNNGSRVCSLDAVMILGGSQSELALSPDGHSKLSSRMVLEHAYHDKLTAIALVRDLLKRKELLVNAMAKMNVQARILRYDFTANNYVAHQTLSDETVFQRQYAWLVVNLDVTNRYLRAALLRLQDVSRVPKVSGPSAAQPSRGDSAMLAAPSRSSALMDPSYQDDRPATLTLEHMRWAVNFLSLSRKKTTDLVAAISREQKRKSTSTVDEQMTSEDHALSSLPLETKELVANCLSLGSVVRGGASANIPPLITQKLMERMFELLAPRFESNMDLYAELQSAAEGVAMMQRQAHQ